MPRPLRCWRTKRVKSQKAGFGYYFSETEETNLLTFLSIKVPWIGNTKLCHKYDPCCNLMLALALKSVRYEVDIKMWGHDTIVMVCVIISNWPNFIHVLTYLEPFLLWLLLQQSAQKQINVEKYHSKVISWTGDTLRCWQMTYVSITTQIVKHSIGTKKFFQVPTVYNIKFQKEFQSYHMYSGSMKPGTRVYPLIGESLICRFSVCWVGE